MSDVIKTHEIHNEAAESVNIECKFDVDPSAATPQFALSAKGTNTPGTFSNGAWATAYTSSTGRIDATTPTIGGAGTLAITAGSSYWVWEKVVVGSETFVRKCAIVECPG